MTRRVPQRTPRAATPAGQQRGPELAPRPFAPASRARLRGGAPVQAKLTVTPAGDRYEQEADRAADAVMRRIAAPAVASASPAAAHPAPLVQLQAEGAAGGPVSGAVEAGIQAARGGGSPLPEGVRGTMEGAFGHDFGRVRVHADARADSLSRSLSATAFTTGGDIFFRQGAYDPGSASGQRLLAHELTHVVQQGQGGAVQRAVVQRKELSAAEVLKALSSISFIKGKLDQRLDLGPSVVNDKPQPRVDPETMRGHVEAVLQQYETHLKAAEQDATARHAMLLATVLEGVARVIAVNVLNDPALTPVMALKLLELYRPEIEAALTSKKQPAAGMDKAAEALDLATALVADDPVALYMHHELRADEAARRVRKLAFLAGQDPLRMYELLRQRFEMQMANLSKAKVEQLEDSSGAYNVKEATGEISKKYFAQLFGNVAQPAWAKGATGARDALTFAPESVQRLKILEDALAKTVKERVDDASPTVTGPGTLSYRQKKHLQEVADDDAAVDQVDLDTRVLKTLKKAMYLTDDSQAATLLDEIKSGLGNLPITITVSGVNWFGKAVPDASPDKSGRAGTSYRAGSSRREEHTYAKLFNKRGAKGAIKSLGTWKKPKNTLQDRGENYNRFRAWKDQRMTGSLGFSDGELPTFAAVNINWNAGSSQSADKKDFGVNAYGDTHFMLRMKNIAGRCVFTATDHGKPHRDIYLAFADLLLGPEGITGLKRVNHLKAVRQVINSLTVGKKIAAEVQPFEVQIFGDVDIAKDVEAIFLAPSVPERARKNAEAFCKRHKIHFKVLAEEQVLEEGYLGHLEGKSQLPQDVGAYLNSMLVTV